MVNKHMYFTSYIQSITVNVSGFPNSQWGTTAHDIIDPKDSGLGEPTCNVAVQ